MILQFGYSQTQKMRMVFQRRAALCRLALLIAPSSPSPTKADPAALTEVPDPCEGRFDTLAGAIAHIEHILRYPDLLLI